MSAPVDPRGWWWERETDDEILEELVPRLLPVQGLNLYVGGYSPGCSEYYGYSLGIVLRRQHWEKVRHNEALRAIPERNIETIGEGGPEVKVQLAVLPKDEFICYHPVGPNTLAAYESRSRRQEEARARYGWKPHQEERSSADPSQVIEHRYYTVSHWAL